MLLASMYPCPYDAGSSHDYSFALIRVDSQRVDRVVPISLTSADVYAYEEGKCNTEKHSGSSHFPVRSLAMGFAELSEAPASVTSWVFPTPSPGYDVGQIFQVLFDLKAIDAIPLESERDDFIASGFLRFVPHQEAHAGLAVYTSPFESGFFFTLDGGGDPGDPRDSIFGTFGGATGLQTSWEAAASRHSLSWFHERLTEYMGFNQLDNGKVSGLAAYGRVIPEVLEYFDSLVIERDKRRPLVDVSRLARSEPDFQQASLDNFSLQKLVNPAPGKLSLVRDLAAFSPFDVAATGEHFFRNLIKTAISTLVEESNVPRNACFSGGVFNNVRLNQELAESGDYKTHFSMAPGDAGLALGSALVSLSSHKDARVQTALLGPSYSRSHTIRVLEEFQLPIREVNAEAVAKLIADGAVVGWFVGRGEYGPRSLGARSILGDPRSPTIKARLNQLAKRRDFFMPFAPAVLAECVGSITDAQYADWYMQVAVNVSEAGKLLIPAAVHVDGSSRIQVVDATQNPEFHDLITAFFALTGVPAVLNTSFNRHGISTIATPRAAIEHLLQGCVEHLYIDGLLVSRSDYVPHIPSETGLHGEQDLLEEFARELRCKHKSQSAQ